MPETATEKTVELFALAAEANFNDKYRKGNLIELPEKGDVVVTGDIHGHRRNFERIVSYCDLEANPERHLVLQEIIHGGPQDGQGGCLSYQLLFDVLRFKLQYPDRVHIIMSNHDTACICKSNVAKNGQEMNRSMRKAMHKEFGDSFEQVDDALRDCLISEPLAVRTANGLWISHSLPADRFIDVFDMTVFSKELNVEDLIRPGSAYLLTWGRRQSEEGIEKLAELFKANMFILGHQPQENGWTKIGQRLIIIASEHNHGCLVRFDLSKNYSMTEMTENIVRLASIG